MDRLTCNRLFLSIISRHLSYTDYARPQTKRRKVDTTTKEVDTTVVEASTEDDYLDDVVVVASKTKELSPQETIHLIPIPKLKEMVGSFKGQLKDIFSGKVSGLS